MTVPPPAAPKIYHIVHVDRLVSIASDGFLWSDAELQQRARPGTVIGMSTIKQRRLTNPVSCRPALTVGDCVPFYFCPRSVMLYVVSMANHPELSYRGGQGPIVHLEADLRETVAWAERNDRKWAFTLSNAGSNYFEDRCDLAQLDEIDWSAIEARDWRQCREEKQAEFLVERSIPWALIHGVGANSHAVCGQASQAVRTADHQPPVRLRPEWYY